eukprot:6459418-Amphidinium_carterae.1
MRPEGCAHWQLGGESNILRVEKPGRPAEELGSALKDANMPAIRACRDGLLELVPKSSQVLRSVGQDNVPNHPSTRGLEERHSRRHALLWNSV